MPEPPKNTALTAALACSRADYRAKWYAVDQELHELCSRSQSQDDYANVYVKVVIIGRVYAAGISRSSRADGDREAAVAQGIVRQAAEIDAALEALTSAQFNRATATRLIELHARTARGSNSTQASGGSSRSCRSTCISTAPSFPILDSRAETSIGGFVDWTSLYRIREAIGRPPNWLTSYYNFVTAFALTSSLGCFN